MSISYDVWNYRLEMQTDWDGLIKLKEKHESFPNKLWQNE